MDSDTSVTPKIALLEDAYAVIDGIPDKQVTLQMWNSSGSLKTTRRTVSCVCTWLGRHPDFQHDGYMLSQSGYDEWCFMARSRDLAKGRKESQANIDFVSDVFGLDYRTAWALFSDRGCAGQFDPLDADTLSDKQLWQARVKRFLEQQQPVGSVDSSLTWVITFDRKARALDILFNDDTKYRFKDVSPGVHQQLIAAASPGKFFNEHIRGGYPTQRVN